jgi:hypothetical protein
MFAKELVLPQGPKSKDVEHAMAKAKPEEYTAKTDFQHLSP